mmetsp:Transcript_6283/g.5617  ORF Transcript_6283/g.5617 Transcript_6283/m.5617 type:complete len:140 (+) Transcript_6283:2-421(+)
MRRTSYLDKQRNDSKKVYRKPASPLIQSNHERRNSKLDYKNDVGLYNSYPQESKNDQTFTFVNNDMSNRSNESKEKTNKIRKSIYTNVDGSNNQTTIPQMKASRRSIYYDQNNQIGKSAIRPNIRKSVISTNVHNNFEE